MSKSSRQDRWAAIADLVGSGDADKIDSPEVPEPARDDTVLEKQPRPSVAVAELLRSQDMLVSGGHLGGSFTDEYRRIKRSLLANAFGATAPQAESGNLVLITSAMPGEGKTHTSVNLALSIAQENHYTVLLVDCDVTNKGMSHLLNLVGEEGLLDLLENEDLSLADVIVRTDIPHLSVLSAGKHHEHVTELLARQRMISLVKEMASRYSDRVIIFDAPPLMGTPETPVLAGLVGQVLLVVEAGKTPQDVVEEALALVPIEKGIGLVMNKSEGRF